MMSYRKATEMDAEILLRWKNDEESLRQSFDGKRVDLEQHQQWLSRKIMDSNCDFFIFEWDGIPVGTTRIDRSEEENVISVNVDSSQRGKGFATQLLQLTGDYFLEKYPSLALHAYIKSTNNASIKAFQKAGFSWKKDIIVAEIASILMSREHV